MLVAMPKADLTASPSTSKARWYLPDGHYLDLTVSDERCPPGKSGYLPAGNPRVWVTPEGSEELHTVWLTSWRTIEEALAWLGVRNPLTRQDAHFLIMPIVVTDVERISWSC